MTIVPSPARARDFYRLLVTAIVPRPIAFVSTTSATGVLNLAPFSFFTVASVNPPIVCFSPLVRSSDGLKKDTLRNIEETKEFVVNIVSESIAEAMNLTSGEYPPDVGEFAISGLTPLESEVVRCPRVKESLVHMECRLATIVPLGIGALSGNLVLGEIVRFHVDDSITNGEQIISSRLQAVGRMGGKEYVRTMDIFELDRPT